MTKNDALNDLNYLKSLAQSGAEAPLLGGPIGLMWGILLFAVFIFQWAVLSGTLSLPQNSLFFAWAAFAIIGGLGSMMLGRKIDAKPGAMSAANRVESYVWIMFAAMLGTLFIGIVLRSLIKEFDPALYDVMVVVGFAGQGLAYGVVAKISGLKWLHLASLAGFVASAVCFVAFGETHIYLIAAIATLFTIVWPSLITLSKARANA